jgi:hypothetical protein
MATIPTPERASVGSYSGLDGSELDNIRDQEVDIARVEIGTRRLRDDPEHPYAIIVLTDGQVFHTWSTYLIEQLAAVPDNAFPVPTTFRKVKTDKNREVWKAD